MYVPTVEPDERDGMTLEEMHEAEPTTTTLRVRQCSGCGVTMWHDRQWCRFCSAVLDSPEDD